MKETGKGRREFLRALGGAVVASCGMTKAQSSKPPNIIFILADDLGYGDVGCFGSSIPTPNIDRMAQEGMRLTRFYSASPVCSPSRAAFLTGRYPVRTGIVNVLMPSDKRGLDPTERTIPRVLKERGYRTALVGKWHLGCQPGVMPRDHSFDEFYGLPYSNDMYPLPMMRNADVVQPAAAQASLTTNFTRQAVDFIQRQEDSPFFLYFAHTAPHIPLIPSEEFRGKSGMGEYGDMVMEVDWSVGEILKAVAAKGFDENTLVIFTSDNGPWYQGSAGKLQGRKGSTYEGGVREPFVARFPGRIPAGVTSEGIGSAMDMLPTFAHLAGATVPSSTVDGVDIWDMLTGEKLFIERDPLLFFDRWDVQCVRWGPWKLHLSRYNSYAWTVDPPGGRMNLPLRKPELYHVDNDPTESYDRAPENVQLVEFLKKRAEELMQSMPDDARRAWRDTFSQHVQETPVGALPAKDGN